MAMDISCPFRWLRGRLGLCFPWRGAEFRHTLYELALQISVDGTPPT
jgi:hypothetical protein